MRGTTTQQLNPPQTIKLENPPPELLHRGTMTHQPGDQRPNTENPPDQQKLHDQTGSNDLWS